MEIQLFCYYSIIIKILRGETFHNHFLQAQKCSIPMCRMLSEGGRSASMDKKLLTKLKQRNRRGESIASLLRKNQGIVWACKGGAGRLNPIWVDFGKGQSTRRTVRTASTGPSGAKGEGDKARREPDAEWGQGTWWQRTLKRRLVLHVFFNEKTCLVLRNSRPWDLT